MAAEGRCEQCGRRFDRPSFYEGCEARHARPDAAQTCADEIEIMIHDRKGIGWADCDAGVRDEILDDLAETIRSHWGGRPDVTYEYRAEVIPVAAGEAGRTTQILNGWAAEGWRLVSANLVAARTLDPSAGGGGLTQGLLVILERAKR